MDETVGPYVALHVSGVLHYVAQFRRYDDTTLQDKYRRSKDEQSKHRLANEPSLDLDAQVIALEIVAGRKFFGVV
jgi:hypothetical protein